ncbi:MAG: LysR family transcriptional regulator [Rubrivivax sp.]
MTPAIIEARWLVFLRVSALGSLSRAATALGLPQSMVSRHIAQLEAECGERLFHRTGRGVALTAFGQQLLPRLSRLAGDAETLADDIRSVGGQPMGEVMVGLLPTAVRRFACPLFAAVRAQMPGVRLHLVEGASAQLEEHLREGRLDLAMVLREFDEGPGDEPVLARVALQLVGRRGDALLASPDIPLAALAGLPLVVPSRPHLLRARLDRLAAEHGLTLVVAVEADSVGLQYEVVAGGGGYAIASALPGPFDDRFASARIVDPVLERQVVLSDSPRRPTTRAVREVKRLIGGLAEQAPLA